MCLRVDETNRYESGVFVAKRPEYSRWRRMPGLYRTGEEKMSDINDEVQRLSHYVSWKVLDEAESQAQRFGFATIQDYCTDLLTRAIDSERIREHVAEVEAKRGTLAGLREIADDPDYLADLSSANLAGSLKLRTLTPSRPEHRVRSSAGSRTSPSA